MEYICGNLGTVSGSPHLRPGVGGVVFALDRPEGALIQINLRQPGSSDPPAGDILAIDNRAWLVVPPAKKMAVAIVTRGNLFLSSVLSGRADLSANGIRSRSRPKTAEC